MGLTDGIDWLGMGEEDGVTDVAPDLVLHRKTFSALYMLMFFGGFLILFLPYSSLNRGRHPISHLLPTLDSTANWPVLRGLASAIATLPSYVVGYIYTLHTPSTSRISLLLSAS